MSIYKLNKNIDKFDKVDISIKYNIGGINYFNYKNEERGYYLHFCPCCFNDHGTYQHIMTEPFHKKSFKTLICPVKRKTNNKFNSLNNILLENIDKIKDCYENKDENDLYKLICDLYKDFKFKELTRCQ